MRKIIIMILALAMIPLAAAADLPDISGLTFDELVQLRDQINLAMWNSQEWQEVTVPAGTWKIGEDIPAGHWSVRIVGHGITNGWYCEKVDDFGQPVCFGAQYIRHEIASEDFHAFDQEYNHVADFDMQEGWYFIVDTPVTFTPYTGKPDLGFK